MAESRAQARQLIGHGHVVVNRKRVDIPSYLVKAGDSIAAKNRPRSLSMVKQLYAEATPIVPDFLALASTDPPEGTVSRLPAASDCSVPVEVQLIVELCSK